MRATSAGVISGGTRLAWRAVGSLKVRAAGVAGAEGGRVSESELMQVQARVARAGVVSRKDTKYDGSRKFFHRFRRHTANDGSPGKDSASPGRRPRGRPGAHEMG